MYQKLLTLTGAFVALTAITTAIIGLSLQACAPDRDQYEAGVKDTTITVATNRCHETLTTDFQVAHCVSDGQFDGWTGLWDECFNLECQASWQPAVGIMCIRCTWPLCEEGFEWRGNDHCPVPESYNWTVSPVYGPGQGQFWEATLTFPPNECLAEEVINCHHFTIRGHSCPL